MKLKIALIAFLTLLILSCHQNNEIPKELKYSFEYLNEHWDSEEIEKFKNIKENDTTPSDYHFGVGMHIRNNLLRHNKRSDSIVKFFNSIGIKHYDYMSGIILTSYHRHLNKTDIDLNGQVNEIVAFLKPTVDCWNKRRTEAAKIYSEYQLNDSIQIKMPVNIIGNKRSVVSYDCPNSDWRYGNSKDLQVKGIITEKYIKKDSFSDNPNEIVKYYYFKIKISYLNNETTQIFMKDVSIGDEIELSLYSSFKTE